MAVQVRHAMEDQVSAARQGGAGSHRGFPGAGRFLQVPFAPHTWQGTALAVAADDSLKGDEEGDRVWVTCIWHCR